MRLPERSDDLSDFQLSLEDAIAIATAEEALARRLDFGLVEDRHIFAAWCALRVLEMARKEATELYPQLADDLVDRAPDAA